MAEINERLAAALENIASLVSARQVTHPHKEIAYIPEFSGNARDLTQFISIVDTHLNNTENARKELIWNSIYNIKITGKAKELLLNNTITSWDSAKALLTYHFRPLSSLKDITKQINGIKVNSIAELHIKIENIVASINNFSLYEANRDNVKQMLYHTLIIKIKDLVTGSLARELRLVNDLTEIKRILYTYVGFDENLDSKNSYPKPQFPQKSKPIPPQNYSNNSERFKQFRSGSDRVNPFNPNRFQNPNRVFNPSGQFRNASQNPQPMDIDNIQKVDETNNNIEKEVFLN